VTGALVLCALVSGAAARAADAYVESVTAGLEQMRAGNASAAATGFRAAMGHDANDPAAWLAYGALLLNTRQVTPARRAFHRAAALAPDSPRTAMALALCDLADGKTADADALLEKAARRGAPMADIHRAYIAAMKGERARAQTLLDDAAPEAGDAPLARAVRAWLAGKSADALAAWERILPTAGESGRPALLASFTPWKPFNHAWQANTHLPLPPNPPPGEPLSGGVPLTAQATADTKYVVFTIDGVDMGITNVRPFTWNWDTTTVPNGSHSIRLTAVRGDGSSKSQEMRVQTKNAHAPVGLPHEGIAAVDAPLDTALSLQPDMRYARYLLAQTALEAGDTATARRRLQGVVADDPKYQNAAQMLKNLPRDTDGVEIWKGPAGLRRIALTFDDGPNPRRTPELLDLLKSLGVHGTFFFVGKQAALYPDIVRRAASEGHEVGNHTWDHPNLSKLSASDTMRELASTNRLLTDLTGTPPRFFRPPGGNINADAREAGAALNVTPAMWTFLGGKTEGLPVETMAPEFIRAAQPGAIFLIHDGTRKIGEMLPTVVHALRAEGYTFVTLSELMGDPAPPMRTAQGHEAAQP
jgi:peptidoglycan/xylan/chitin deacetylase (PgdA/CDA1 family)